VLCCVVLCCVVLCCVVLCCVVLCCTLLCYVALCCTLLCCVVLCCVVRGIGGSVTSEFVGKVGSILATDSCGKSQSTLCRRKSWVLRFPPTGKVDRVG
jgi:hypothetical protein